MRFSWLKTDLTVMVEEVSALATDARIGGVALTKSIRFDRAFGWDE